MNQMALIRAITDHATRSVGLNQKGSQHLAQAMDSDSQESFKMQIELALAHLADRKVTVAELDKFWSGDLGVIQILRGE